MLALLSEDKELNYKVYRSPAIVDHQSLFIKELEFALSILQKEFPGRDTTWNYRFYNTFCITSSSSLFYDLFSDLKVIIREYAGHDRPLWVQSWINYHWPHQLLDWHNHLWTYHGYISIDPKESSTIFDQYTIDNQVGNIYIGPGRRRHRVECSQEFATPRITLGFDVTDRPGVIKGQFSLIPI